MKWILLFLLPASALATPRMSLTAGTPCAACHVNPTGGEGRTELGWSAMNHAGAATWDQLGWQRLHDSTSNGWFDGALLFGFDYRGLMARLGRPELVDSPSGTKTVIPDYTAFPMQVQPYLTVKPASKLTLYGTYLMGPGTLRDGKFCDPVFPGMSCYGAQAQYVPGGGRPEVRAGVFQPGIGVRHDDHTILIRGDAAQRRQPVIAPGYAEVGAEVAWQPKQWVRLEVGGFGSQNLDLALNDGSETAELWPALWQSRLTFQPLLELGGGAPEGADEFDDFDAPPATPFVLNTWFGASALGSGDFLLINGFAGLGIHQGLALLSEVSWSQRTIEYTTLNGLVGLSYTPWAWVSAGLRAERAQTTTALDEDVTWQYVASLEFFPLPYVELRPEYRLVETEAYRFGQFTLQWHVFY